MMGGGGSQPRRGTRDSMHRLMLTLCPTHLAPLGGSRSQLAAAVAAALGLTATTALADSPGYWQILPQDTASSTAQAQVDLHHDVTFFVIAILASVFYMFFHVSSSRTR